MTKNIIDKVPCKYKERVFSFEKFPPWAGGAPYRVQLNEGWENYEGDTVCQPDTLKEALWIIKSAMKVEG